MEAHPVESIQQGIIELFQTDEDVQTVHKIGSAVQKVHETANAKEKRAHQLIRDLLDSVSKMEEEATRPEAEEVITARFEELERNKTEKDTQLAACQEEQQNRESQLQGLEQEIEKAQTAKKEAESESMTHVTAAQNCNSLYKSATGINWDYEKADVIAGTASNPNTGHLADFEVDPMAMSDFEIANAIWDAIDEQ